MKNILIIGANSSIAQHCGRIWAQRGDTLFLVGRNREKLKTLESDLRIRGAAKVKTYCADLNELNKHSTIVDAAEIFLNRIDIVFVAHGTLSDQNSCEQNVEETVNEIHTNAISAISLLTIIAQRFEAKKEGTIAVISSVAGDRGRASNYVYGCAKATITAFTSGLRQRLHKSNVAVVTIKPGFVDTPMTATYKKSILWAKPASVAKTIVKAIDKRKNEVAVPVFWVFVMLIIKMIPEVIFKRLKI